MTSPLYHSTHFFYPFSSISPLLYRSFLSSSSSSFFSLPFLCFVCPTEIIAFSEQLSGSRPQDGCTGLLPRLCILAPGLVNTQRPQGGLGEMKISILTDFTKKIATDYGVLKEDESI